jgi:dihydropteroate synthase
VVEEVVGSGESHFRLGRHSFNNQDRLIMAVINRTPDSFYDKGRHFDEAQALTAVEQVVDAGAHIVDIGGVKAGPGPAVGVEEELRRTVSLVEAIRSRFPELIISVDTWRSEVADAVCSAGADILNDAWGGFDPKVAEVAARFDVALVCTHTGGASPRTRPHRVSYDDLMADVRGFLAAEARRAETLGVDPQRIIVDPGHDFGKNTWHSLNVTRELATLTALGRPLLVSLSRKDFIGETLDRPVEERLTGTLATTAICSWLGAQLFRVHDVEQTRDVLQMVSAIQGTTPPRFARRGLA